MNTNQKRLLAVAEKQIGTREGSGNDNKYGAELGLNHVAWCAIFVSWVYQKAGLPLGTIDYRFGFGLVANGYRHFKRRGELTSSPIPGSIVLYKVSRRNNRVADHTGIFVGWANSARTEFWAIEGNTGSRSVRNGDGVFKKRRSTKLVVAFATPGSLVGGKTPPAEKHRPTLRRGSRGSLVMELQRLLNGRGGRLGLDGIFGPKTENAVRRFQRSAGISVDGIVGPQTWGRLT